MDYQEKGCGEMPTIEGPKQAFEAPEYEAFWEARMAFQRAMDLAENARHMSGAVKVYRLSLALAQEKIRDMANTLMILEKKAMEEEEALNRPPSSW
jgi:hypothetical protein